MRLRLVRTHVPPERWFPLTAGGSPDASAGEKSPAAHDSGSSAKLPPRRPRSPPHYLEAKTGLAALHRRDGLKSAALLGKIQHDATILFPELQVNELLRSSAYDRALVLSCRFHVQFRLNNSAGKGKRGAENLCLLAQQARPLILSDQA
jgi:hypothetical protein